MHKPASSRPSVRIDKALAARIDAAIQRLGEPDSLNRTITQSEMIRMALEEFLQRHEASVQLEDGQDDDNDGPEPSWAVSIPIEEARKAPPIPKLPAMPGSDDPRFEQLWS